MRLMTGFFFVTQKQEGVAKFINILADYGIVATPRTRRGELNVLPGSYF